MHDSPKNNSAESPLVPLFLASSNKGKLEEFRTLALEAPDLARFDFQLLPNFSALPAFEESAPTFAENAAGKAIHYSRFSAAPVLADDSGLCVNALDGAPGIYSARYAGPNASSADCIRKLLKRISETGRKDRQARFVCVLALAVRGRTCGVFSGSVEGEILESPRGSAGFGYDPVFFYPSAGKSFAEISSAEKNRYSHRARAFRRLAKFLASSPML